MFLNCRDCQRGEERFLGLPLLGLPQDQEDCLPSNFLTHCPLGSWAKVFGCMCIIPALATAH